MSSPTSRPEPSRPEPVRLSVREQAVLARLATHERLRDAAFADLLARGREPGARSGAGSAAVAVTVVAAVLVLVAFVLGGTWMLALVAVGVLVVVPTALVVWAVRQGTVDPDTTSPD